MTLSDGVSATTVFGWTQIGRSPEVAKAVGHSDPRLTLWVYAHVSLEELSKAAKSLPVPKPCAMEQLANRIPLAGMDTLLLGGGKSLHLDLSKGTCDVKKKEAGKHQKPAKYRSRKSRTGRGERIRTSGLFVPNEAR